ncbi:hypothetical protein ASE75_11025 [Sphingomonas sp. Leaf17]|uniref:DUF1178 family protein n=1 Tax=Sphingomonas sp. Leaf17 TaxID=1735683 RepID=UPI0006FC6214|nr:DUF1178 family protein [Sphingomonas sp. Leaf17]KQM63640.1 hypothetical protein ASE75_11025 [Sphingomonas sp. Leaf17]
MIVFDLKCGAAHVFEAWFASSAAFADQQASGAIHCPVCGDTAIAKAMMAPNIAAKGQGRSTDTEDGRRKQMLTAIARAQAVALKESHWVGTDFSDRARAMHDGEEPTRGIHGQATVAQARALVADGVPVMPLLVPVVPPKAIN